MIRGNKKGVKVYRRPTRGVGPAPRGAVKIKESLIEVNEGSLASLRDDITAHFFTSIFDSITSILKNSLNALAG